MGYVLHLTIYFSMYAILASSLNIVLGFGGMFSLAHAAFFSIGAYSYAILSVGFGWGFVPATIAGVGLAGLASLAISLPSWRLRGDYLLMMTMAAQAFVYSLIYNWHNLGEPIGSLTNLTNGPYGIMDVPRPRFLGLQQVGLGGTALVAAIAAGCTVLLIAYLVSSPWGRVLNAMRDDELAARNLGKNTRSFKVQALAIGCGLAAVAGAIYASYAGYVDPTLCSLDESVLLLAMVLLGGTGSVWGPLVGAAIILGIPEVLRAIDFPTSVAGNARLLIFGALLVVVVHFRPQGVIGRLRAIS